VYLACAFIFCTAAFSQQSTAKSSDSKPLPLTGLKVEHITFSVADVNRETGWLEKVFGFKVAHSGGDANATSKSVTIPEFRIDLIQYKGSSRPQAPNPRYLQQGFIHIVFQVPDLQAAYKRLQELKQEVERETQPKNALWGLRLHDPEGNEIELTQYGHQY
jgi:catechol-2,3-dioxygenase